MVYRVSKVGNSTANKTIAISFISKWITYALICYLVIGVSDDAPLAPDVW